MAKKDWEIVSESENGIYHRWVHKTKSIGVESSKWDKDTWEFEVMKNGRVIKKERVKSKAKSMALAKQFMRTH